jgi:hypothetical protein
MTTELTLTGYQLSQVLNVKLEEVGIKEIPSQMIYNYIRKGYITTVTVEGKKRVTLTESKRFIATYLESKRNTSNSLAELMKNFTDTVEEEEGGEE